MKGRGERGEDNEPDWGDKTFKGDGRDWGRAGEWYEDWGIRRRELGGEGRGEKVLSLVGVVRRGSGRNLGGVLRGSGA